MIGAPVVISNLANSVRITAEGTPVYGTPLEAMVVGTDLRSMGAPVQLHDLQGVMARGDDPYVALKALLEEPATLHCITGLANMTPELMLTLASLGPDPNRQICIMGLGPAGVEARILELMPNVTYVVPSTDAKAIVNIIKSLRNHGEYMIPGVYQRGPEGIVDTAGGGTGFLADKALDWSLVNLDDYPMATTFTTGGCRWNCPFCKRPLLYKRRRFKRNLVIVKRELDALVKDWRNVDWGLLQINDDTFFAEVEHSKSFCLLMEKYERRLNWACFLRVSEINKEMLEYLHRANCTSVFIGLECGTDHMLQDLNKGSTVEDAKRACELTLEYIPHVRAGFLWNLPDETLEDFHQTVKLALWAASKGVEIACLSSLMLFGGTKMYKQHVHELKGSDLYTSHATSFDSGSGSPASLELIGRYPELFSAHYWLPNPDFDEKAAVVLQLYGLLEDMGRLNPTWFADDSNLRMHSSADSGTNRRNVS